MNLIIFSRRRGDARQIGLLRPLPIAAAGALLTVVFASGYFAASYRVTGVPAADVAELRQELETQREQLAAAEQEARENVDALTARIGQLNAHVIRVDALGRRLVDMADLDDGEFNFGEPPARGGPDSDEPGLSAGSSQVTAMLDDLALQIDDRSDQLAVLERLLTNRRVKEAQRPEGRPIASGWLSSYYGKRTDPFSGKQAYHRGIDFAGNAGSDVLAVASGVVTWSGKRYGYGTMVEVSHGDGLVTRYAHNSENLVEVGQTVKKGQRIALMGRSGRATGPHVHFEVLKNGQKVNPLKYVQR
jgi:murein DD-endopeptidase MepM/ murein hydrolase activator NlpD